jgi:integrase
MSPSQLAVARHLDHLRQRGLAPSTIYQRRRALARLDAVLTVPLLDAGPAELAAWRAGLTTGAEATVSTYACHVREFYAWALAEGLIYINPAAGLPRLRRLLPRPIAEKDLFAALAAAPRRVRPWLVLAGWAGLRAKEIALLRRQNILDTAAPPVLIVAADATTAKGSRERVVPLSGFVLGELHAYGLPAAGWVFRRGDNRPGPNEPRTISHLANAHLHACGIAATLHQLRHRFGTQAYRESGRDLRVVQELLGHASPSTTVGYAAYDGAPDITCRPCIRADAAAAVEALPVPGRLRAVRDTSMP